VQLFDRLQRQGVIVRPLKAFGLPHCLRITIGKKDENEMLVEALKKGLE
jgi:histidinol-phosphate aminotransferase